MSFVLVLAFLKTTAADEKKEENPPQYQFEQISIPPASADEPRLEKVSSPHKALDYLDRGALAWNGSRKCVTCHTNGTYMVIRPSLTGAAGLPNEEIAPSFCHEPLINSRRKKLEEQQEKRCPRPGDLFGPLVFAEWDAHIHKKLSPETWSKHWP